MFLIYFRLLFFHVFSLFSGRFSSIHLINGNKIDLNCFQNKNTRTIYIVVFHHRVNLFLVESYQSIMHCHIITLMSLLISLKNLRYTQVTVKAHGPLVYFVEISCGLGCILTMSIFFLSVSRMLCNKWITDVKG